MQHTREELVRFGSEKVRAQPNLFSLFKKYLEEDVKHIYPNGRLPSNCFSCTFNLTFEKWKNYVVGSEHYTKKIKMSNTKTTYILKDPKTKIFFNGILLDRNSDDESWNQWINYNPEDEKVLIKKSYFEKLPNSAKEGAETKNTKDVGTSTEKEKETLKTPENNEENKVSETATKNVIKRATTRGTRKAK